MREPRAVRWSNRRVWDELDTVLLVTMVAAGHDWSAISRCLDGRWTPVQCMTRYYKQSKVDWLDITWCHGCTTIIDEAMTTEVQSLLGAFGVTCGDHGVVTCRDHGVAAGPRTVRHKVAIVSKISKMNPRARRTKSHKLGDTNDLYFFRDVNAMLRKPAKC